MPRAGGPAGLPPRDPVADPRRAVPVGGGVAGAGLELAGVPGPVGAAAAFRSRRGQSTGAGRRGTARRGSPTHARPPLRGGTEIE